MNNEVVSSLGNRAFAEPAAAAVAGRMLPPVLEIDDLHVHFVTSHGTVRAVEGLSYSVHPGEMVAIVGESGSGKSVSALAVMRLLPPGTARIPSGRIRFDGGKELLKLSEEEMRRIRGRDMAMIFQEPMTSLNPVLRIGLQIMEPLTIHLNMDEKAARERAIELLTLVGITDPESRLAQYPHQLSGGMRQRVMIAIGLACNPKLLIADEPTTALDVTIQAQILELMKDLSRRLGIAVIIITHNLGIVARYADRVNVMYAARLAESGTAERVFSRPLHPYARGLLAAVPRLDRGRNAKLATIDGAPPNLLAPPEGCRFRPRCPFAIEKCHETPPLAPAEPGHLVSCHRAAEIEALDPQSARAATAAKVAHVNANGADVILDIKHASKFFPIRSGLFRAPRMVRAVNDVTLDVKRGETLGLVGESGCGKSTLGRLVLRLDDPTAGEILFEGVDLAKLKRGEMVAVRKRMQVIFQDPYSSLNPRMTVGQIIAEPMRVHEVLAQAPDTGPGIGAAAARRPVPLHGAALPARAVGRAAAARRHRARLGREPQSHRVRRGRIGARCVDPGPGDQPAGRPAAEARADLSVHRPRSGRGAAYLEQGRRHVSGAHRRVRAGRRAVRPSQASIYASAARCRTDPRSRHRTDAAETHHHRRAAEPAQSARRLRVSSALSAGDRGLQEGRACNP